MADKQRLEEDEVSSASDAWQADHGDLAQRSRRPPTFWSSNVELAGTGPAMRGLEMSIVLSAASSAPVLITRNKIARSANQHP
jgi:hypothetical protein